MNQIKAFNILSSLTKDEFIDFGRFIVSPYFNRSKDVIKLFNYIKPYYPVFEDSKINYEKIYKKIYPLKKFNEGTVRNLLSDLGNLTERFLSFSVYEDCFFYKYNLLIEMNDRKLDKYFIKTYTKYHNEVEGALDTTGQKDLYLFLMETEKNINTVRTNREDKIEDVDSGKESLLIYLLKIYFGSESSFTTGKDNYNRPVNENNIIQDFFRRTDVKGLIETLKKNNAPGIKKLELYYFVYLAHRNSNNDYYENILKALEMLSELEYDMVTGEKFNFYTELSNIANRFMKAGDYHVKELLFKIKKECVEKGITSEQISGRLWAMDFIIIIDSALAVNELDWAENFLETKIKAVEKNQREDLYNFYKARVLFERNNFPESNEYLGKVNQESVFFKLDIKVQRMKSFYELNFLEAAYSQAEAFKQFLARNNTVSEKRRKSFSNFLKYYLQILKKKTGGNSDISLLKKEISNCTAIRNRDWLLKKAGELSNVN